MGGRGGSIGEEILTVMELHPRIVRALFQCIGVSVDGKRVESASVRSIVYPDALTSRILKSRFRSQNGVGRNEAFCHSS